MKDYIGFKIFDLTVISQARPHIDPINRRVRQVKCKCACGSTKVVRLADLKRGRHKSCGCHANRHGMRGTKFYKIWADMKQRVTNSNRKDWKHYGGRGISMDARWEDFNAFKTDKYGSYLEGLELDRIDNNGHYTPDNTRWVTRKENCRNTRKNVTYKNKCAAEWAEIWGVSKMTAWRRVKKLQECT